MPVAKQALVFAAGPAQRLLPLTENRPKGMLLVGGRPLLQHAIEALAAHGVERIAIVIGKDGEKVQSFFKDGQESGVRIDYVHQPQPLGTMDAVKRALPALDLAQPTWILPGHAFVSKDLLEPLAKAQRTTLLVATAADEHVQGVPALKGELLRGMHHEAPVVGSTRVTTNILRAEPDLLKALAHEDLAGHKEFDLALGDWASRGNEVAVAATPSPWHAVVGPWDLLRLNEWVLASTAPPRPVKESPNVRGRVHVGDHCHIAPTAILVGPLTIGDGCTIDDYSVVGPFVSIRNGTVIGSHCEVRRSILNNNVVLDGHSVLRGGILDDGVQVGAGFLCDETPTPNGLRGCIIGRDSVLAAGTKLAGATVLPAEARVGP